MCDQCWVSYKIQCGRECVWRHGSQQRQVLLSYYVIVNKSSVRAVYIWILLPLWISNSQHISSYVANKENKRIKRFISVLCIFFPLIFTRLSEEELLYTVTSKPFSFNLNGHHLSTLLITEIVQCKYRNYSRNLCIFLTNLPWAFMFLLC